MKIQLERKLTTCPNQLRCAVCDRPFEASNIRALLYSDRSFIQGDICPKCLQLKAEQIQQKLRERAMILIEEPFCAPSTSPHEALELLETSTENIKFPTFHQWLIKRLELPQKSQEPQTPISWLSNFRSGKL